MNDAAEFEHYGCLVLDEISRQAEPGDGDFSTRAVAEVCDMMQRAPTFVVSLCNEGDLLSQWRGYGGEVGFALGFDEAALGISVSSHDWNSGDCNYDAAVAARQAADSVSYALEQYRQGDFDDDEWSHPASWLAKSLASNAPRHKHPGFQEEGEFRLYGHVWGWMPDKWEHMKPKGQSIAPYYPFRLTPGEHWIREIVVGPQPNQANVVTSLQLRLGSDVKVRPSTVPYRLL